MSKLRSLGLDGAGEADQEVTAVAAEGWVPGSMCGSVSVTWAGPSVYVHACAYGCTCVCVCVCVCVYLSVCHVGWPGWWRGAQGSLCVDFERRSSQLCPVYSRLVAGFLWLFAFLILGLD